MGGKRYSTEQIILKRDRSGASISISNRSSGAEERPRKIPLYHSLFTGRVALNECTSSTWNGSSCADTVAGQTTSSVSARAGKTMAGSWLLECIRMRLPPSSSSATTPTVFCTIGSSVLNYRQKYHYRQARDLGLVQPVPRIGRRNLHSLRIGSRALNRSVSRRGAVPTSLWRRPPVPRLCPESAVRESGHRAR